MGEWKVLRPRVKSPNCTAPRSHRVLASQRLPARAGWRMSPRRKNRGPRHGGLKALEERPPCSGKTIPFVPKAVKHQPLAAPPSEEAFPSGPPAASVWGQLLGGWDGLGERHVDQDLAVVHTLACVGPGVAVVGAQRGAVGGVSGGVGG